MTVGRLALSAHGTRYRAPGERFLRGPIPWDWLLAAMSLPGKALAVAIHVHFQAGVTGASKVMVNLSRMSIDRSAASRGLQALERAGLVMVTRGRGRKPSITILSLPPTPHGRPQRRDA